jgi:hypothetical protein
VGLNERSKVLQSVWLLASILFLFRTYPFFFCQWLILGSEKYLIKSINFLCRLSGVKPGRGCSWNLHLLEAGVKVSSCEVKSTHQFIFLAKRHPFLDAIADFFLEIFGYLYLTELFGFHDYKVFFCLWGFTKRMAVRCFVVHLPKELSRLCSVHILYIDVEDVEAWLSWTFA